VKQGEDALLFALRADLAGRQKSTALTVYPDATSGTAEARMSRLLAGEFGDAVWRTLAAVLRDGAPHLLAAIGDLAGCDWTPRKRDAADLRTEALEQLGHVREQLELISRDLREADELNHERRGPHRVRPKARRESA